MGLFDERTGGLVTYWKSVSAITALIGSGDSCRAWPDGAKQGQPAPFVVYTRAAGGEVFRHLTGTSGRRSVVCHVYCWGDTRTAADALCEAVKTAMESGFARNTWAGIYVNACFVDEPFDGGHDQPIDGSDAKRYWSRLVLRIVHSESGGT